MESHERQLPDGRVELIDDSAIASSPITPASLSSVWAGWVSRV